MSRCTEHGKVMPHYRCDESEDWLDELTQVADELSEAADEIDAAMAATHARLADGELDRRREEIMARVRKRLAGDDPRAEIRED